jgi:PAS domain S-box-containing protein
VPGGFRTKIITYRNGVRQTRLIWRDAAFKLLMEGVDPNDPYDPRIRPWYKRALKANRIVWTDPYIFFTSQKPGITIAGPCQDSAGQVKMVVGVDIEIDQLSTFIASLKIGRHGRAFMLNRNRDIVAFPDLSKLKYAGLESSPDIRLAKIHELDDPLSRQAFEAAGFQYDNEGLLKLSEPQFASFEFEGKVYHAMFMPFSSWEWPWIIGVHLPEDDYLGAIKTNRRFNMLVTLGISIFAAILGFLLTRGIIRPIDALDRDARFIQNNDFNERPTIHSIYKEIQTTADSFARMKAAVNKSRKKYQGIFENIQDVYYESDLDGTLLEVSPSIERVLHYTRDELLGQSLRTHYEDPAVRDRMIKDLLANDKINDHEIVLKDKGGALVVCSLNSVLVKDAEGRTLKIIGSLRNVTDRKNAEQKLLTYRDRLEDLVKERTTDLVEVNASLRKEIDQRRQVEDAKQKLERQLQQAQRMKAIGTLAGGIAHDFNNLLMGIQGNLSLLMLRVAEHEPKYEYLTAIERCVESGANLTRQLLGYARGGKYVVAQINLNDTIRRTIGLFGRTRKEVNIHARYQEDLWPVNADQGQMDQVLVNLYLNAWQAMTTNKDIYLTTKNVELDEAFVQPFNVSPGRYVMIAVRDNGSGMDALTQEHIFEPFFTTKKMGIGTGLGLASVFGIIKNHEGIIDVESALGQGSSFYIYLPATETEAVETHRSPVGTILPGSETIMVIDDEEYILASLQAMLESLGYSVMNANGGRAAVELYEAQGDAIDLVLLDMIMPDMSGREVFDRIKTVRPDAKVILASGYSLNSQAEDVLNRGGSGFIQKPVDLVHLSQMIREVLDRP